MGWHHIYVAVPTHTGNGWLMSVWGWDRADAERRARERGLIVLPTQIVSSNATTP